MRNRNGISKNEWNKLKKTNKKSISKKSEIVFDDAIRLNKYIANAGLCSRRDADELIKTGAIKVNGTVVTELGTKVKSTDKIQYGNQTLQLEQKKYLLLNKPKDYITTMQDEFGRKTVYELIRKACKERLKPVGRLDRNTTGLLLFTNDGELAKKLMHPKFNIKKLYHVQLDKNVKMHDLEKIAAGIHLDDGIIKADSIDYAEDATDKKQIGIELHSGKNRIVRRIFEHLGYRVIKLDRIMFAGLTKKNIPRGKYRFLTQKEIAFLKML